MIHFKENRKKCIWKQRTNSKNTKDCILKNVNFHEQGEGILQITRIGPYTTTGGTIAIKINQLKIPPPNNSLMIFFTSSPLDPYTETYYSYPPYHLHHLITNDFVSSKERQMYKNFTYLDNSPTVRTNNFPRMSSDQICLESKGGIDCLLFKSRDGFSIIPHFSNKSMISSIIEDVRESNSPPISFILEYTEGFIMNTDNNKLRMKSNLNVQFNIMQNFSIKAKYPNYTYKLKENSSSYIYETFYIPTKSIFYQDNPHAHWKMGDERWIILGDPMDLGLGINSKKYHNHIYSENYINPSRDAIDHDDLKKLKLYIENHININKEKFISNQNHKDIKFLEYTDENKLYMNSQKPQILCKYYGITEHINENYIIKAKQKYMKLIETYDPQSKLYQNALLQINNMFIGIKNGNYYRRPYRSQSDFQNNQQINQYQNCSYIEIEAGNFLTFIQFDIARKPGEGLFQHLIQFTSVNMPNMPELMKPMYDYTKYTKEEEKIVKFL